MIVESKISSSLGIKSESFLVFVSADSACNYVSGLECTISEHRENINDIMRETVDSIESAFIIIFDIECAACHLSDTVVDSLICVNSCFEESMFK